MSRSTIRLHGKDKKKMTQTFDWTQTPEDLRGKRVVFIGDGQEGYYAELPAGMTEQAAIDSFIETYDYNEQGTEEALREAINSEVFERFDGSHGEIDRRTA